MNKKQLKQSRFVNSNSNSNFGMMGTKLTPTLLTFNFEKKHANLNFANS